MVAKHWSRLPWVSMLWGIQKSSAQSWTTCLREGWPRRCSEMSSCLNNSVIKKKVISLRITRVSTVKKPPQHLCPHTNTTTKKTTSRTKAILSREEKFTWYPTYFLNPTIIANNHLASWETDERKTHFHIWKKHSLLSKWSAYMSHGNQSYRILQLLKKDLGSIHRHCFLLSMPQSLSLVSSALL